MAAQLTLTSGPATRVLQAWMTSANTSLPTPLSPVMRTRLSEGATREISRNNACISGLRATICPGNCLPSLNRIGAVREMPVAWRTEASNSSRSIGLAR